MPLPTDHHTDLQPPRREGLGGPLALAVAAHVGLIAALALGVNWRASEPEGLQAELWAAVPQVAAPRGAPPPEPAPPPPPPPPISPRPAPAPPPPAKADAQIAVEKEKARREQLQRQREEDERERREAAQKAKAEKERVAKADAERQKKEREAKQRDQQRVAEAKRKAEEQQRALDAQRADNLKRIQAMAGATGSGDANSTGTAARSAGPSAGYAGRIKAAIQPNIVLADELSGNPQAEVEVRAGPDGTIIGRRLTKSSGSSIWDEAVLRAIDRTGVLPRDTDGRVPSPLLIVFRPRDF